VEERESYATAKSGAARPSWRDERRKIAGKILQFIRDELQEEGKQLNAYFVRMVLEDTIKHLDQAAINRPIDDFLED